ncbi:uncharacterized protein M6B38_275880 [Iris pallida]|uniref:Uncharacterized protein n=1 Tax=Iris pallida TaxID=29817 RepID=A0AAX6I8H0_IRIPA|nr:uncharacterized protein M6B38_275880 [Iris pallida]
MQLVWMCISTDCYHSSYCIHILKISITLLFFIMNSMSHGLSSEICRVGTQGT